MYDENDRTNNNRLQLTSFCWKSEPVIEHPGFPRFREDKAI